MIVVGSANVDHMVAVDRYPGPGETVLGSDAVVVPGGKGANAAVAAARAGGRVALLGAVGADAGADLIRGALATAGVDISLLREVSGPSGAAYITVTHDGENAIVVAPGANALLSAEHVREAKTHITAARVLFTVLEVPMSTVRCAVALAAEAGVRIVLNASPVADLDPETLAVLDPLIVNAHEAAQLIGRTDLWKSDQIATELLARGPRSVMVTLGSAGAVVAAADHRERIAAPQVAAVDTTGAGDTVAGVLAWRLAAGAGLVDAAREAVAAASIAVTRRGAQGEGA